VQGDMLVSFDHGLSRVELIETTDAAPQDRAWRDGGNLVGLSAAHALLLSQSSGSGSGGPLGSAYFWPPGDRQPVRIAEGRPLALSPDGRKALVSSALAPPTVSIVPTGAGRPQVLELGPIESITWAGWHTDGRIVIEFARPGGKPVAYVLSPDGRNPAVLLPEGVTLRGDNLMSPDGSRIVANDAEGKLVVCTIAALACQPLPGSSAREAVAGWTADSKSVFVYRGQVVPTQIDRLEVASGARSAWKTVRPNFPAVAGIRTLIVSPDGAMVYGYRKNSSELYVIKGLK